MSKRKATRTLPSVEFISECLNYDPETGVFMWKERPREHFDSDWVCKRWNTRYSGTIAGNISVHGYRIIKIEHHLRRAQRIAWKLMTGEEPPEQVDHIDGNPLNNAFRNLRAATQTESNWNSRTRECVSGYRGVSRNGKKWKAQISIAGRIRHLGTYDTPADAAAVYDAVALTVHRKFYRSPLTGRSDSRRTKG